MAGKTTQELTALVKIMAVASGFEKAGAQVQKLGSMLKGVSDATIEFGKQSVDTYRQYETSMAEAEVALSTRYGRNTRELQEVMKGLGESAEQWAQTTIFHTDDVAAAIADAARAGWDYEEILNGIPASMNLAQAGGMELSDTIQYLSTMAKAAGVDFEDLGSFVDQWVFSANSSATTVQEVGETMTALGSFMQFTDSTEEMFTLTAALAQMGVRGSEAGTMMRNAILRLAAPTKKAQGELDDLNITLDEYGELMENGAEETVKELEKLGFSAYDAQGNLKPIIEIYEDLGSAMSGMEEQDANRILNTIFGTRGIIGAKNLLEGVTESWYGIWDAMQAGEHEGYGDYAADVMMNTLKNKIEAFNSKVEELELKVGKILAPQIEDFLGTLGGFVDGLNGMDSASMQALVSGFEVIAASAPMLIAAGVGLKAFGTLLTPGGAIAAGAVALGATVAALEKLQEVQFKDSFGDMALDMDTLNGHITGLTAGFTSAWAQANQFRDVVDQSVESYRTASSEFSNTLLTEVLTKNGELGQPEIEKLQSIGEQMFDALNTGLYNKAAANIATAANLLDGSENSGMLEGIVSLIEESADQMSDRLKAVGKSLSEAIAQGMKDGSLDDTERQTIMDYIGEYNDVAMQLAERDRRIQQQKWLRQAQNASIDDIMALTATVTAERNGAEENIRAQYYDLIDAVAVDAEMQGWTEERTQEAINGLTEGLERELFQNSSGYDDFLLTLYNTELEGSGLSGLNESLSDIVTGYLTGSMDFSERQIAMRDLQHAEGADDLAATYAMFMAGLGGTEGVEAKIREYRRVGNTEMEDRLARFYAAEQLMNEFDVVTANGTDWYTSSDRRRARYGVFGTGYNRANAENALFGDAMNEWRRTVYDMATEGTEEVYPVTSMGEIPELAEMSEQDMTLEVSVEGDTEPLQSAISALNGQSVYVDVVANEVTSSGPRTEKDTESKVKPRKFAEGGRATTASIFGEAGPEWAIPEAHTARTYSLLSAAISASGFGGEMGGTLVYSPTINAMDANGVERVLSDDKRRLEKLLNDRREREEAVRYS